MIKNIFLVFCFALPQFSNAADGCDNSILKSDSLYNLPGAGYWMQAMGDCRITYTSVGGISSKMYNLCNRKTEEITANIDAYALPEGDLYVHPGDMSGLKFYKTSDVLANGRQTVPFYSDRSFAGNYQSIGVLEAKPNERTIRVIMGNQGGTFKDYKIKQSGDNYTVEPLHTAPVSMCKNIPSGGLDKEVPVLSRDGKYIAGRDFGSRTMKIYKFDPTNGNCELVNDIPLVTSKVSFSFDNKNVLFVVNDPNTRKGRLLQMNILTGEIKTVSSPLEDVQYMTSKQSGEILYTRRSDTGNGSESTLVKLSKNAISDVPQAAPYEAIGMLWAKKCNLNIDLDYALAIGQRINSEQCLSVVSTGNLSLLSEEHKNFKTEDLKKICSSSSSAKTPEAGSGQDSGVK